MIYIFFNGHPSITRKKKKKKKKNNSRMWKMVKRKLFLWVSGKRTRVVVRLTALRCKETRGRRSMWLADSTQFSCRPFPTTSKHPLVYINNPCIFVERKLRSSPHKFNIIIFIYIYIYIYVCLQLFLYITHIIISLIILL